MVSPPFEDWFLLPPGLPDDRDAAAWEAARRIEAAGIKVRMGKRGRVVIVRPAPPRPAPTGVFDRMKGLLERDLAIELRFRRSLFRRVLRARYEKRPTDDGGNGLAGAAEGIGGAVDAVGVGGSLVSGAIDFATGLAGAREELKEAAHRAWAAPPASG